MSQLVAVSQIYYDLTHKVISGLNDKGLEGISDRSGIPFVELKKFRETTKLDGQYVPTLYSRLFGDRTFVQANSIIKNELEEYVEFLNKG